jgi:hypothetical protein
MTDDSSVPVTLEHQDFVPGRIVRFVDLVGKYHPMIIVNVRKDPRGTNHRIDGVAFGEFGAMYIPDVLHDQARAKGTWHWPVRQQRKNAPAKPQPGKPLYVPKGR